MLGGFVDLFCSGEEFCYCVVVFEYVGVVVFEGGDDCFGECGDVDDDVWLFVICGD